MFNRRRNDNRREEPKPEWVPRTEIGRMVKEGKITSIEEIYKMGKPVLEHEIVDHFFPDLKDETLEIRSTQRVTDCGRKAQFRAVILIGDSSGHFGIGVGKSEEVKPAIESAIKCAKRNMICVPFGSGSWEDKGDYTNSIPVGATGKCGSATVTLKPAPRSLGVVANKIVKKILQKAGIKDVWTSAKGRTSNILNMAFATQNAVEALNTIAGATWQQYPNPRLKKVRI